MNIHFLIIHLYIFSRGKRHRKCELSINKVVSFNWLRGLFKECFLKEVCFELDFKRSYGYTLVKREGSKKGNQYI